MRSRSRIDSTVDLAVESSTVDLVVKSSTAELAVEYATVNITVRSSNRCRQVLYLVSSTAECYLSRKYGLRVGAPYGGVCLPKDVPELTSLAPEGSVFREFLAGTGKINEWISNTPTLKVW